MPVQCGSLEAGCQACLPSHSASKHLPVSSRPAICSIDRCHTALSGCYRIIAIFLRAGYVCTRSSLLILTWQEAASGFTLRVGPLSLLRQNSVHHHCASRKPTWLPPPPPISASAFAEGSPLDGSQVMGRVAGSEAVWESVVSKKLTTL